MKILYLSCHSILEYDELKLFEELGYDYWSMGSYIHPQFPHDMKRPPLNGKYYDHLISVSQVHTKDNLHPEQVEPFDVVIVMHVGSWIEKNWEVLKGKRVIWRTIGQSIPRDEEFLREYRKQGLQIVRYSPLEANIPGYIGADAFIRFYKDPDEFKDWNGNNPEVINFTQDMPNRGENCNYEVFRKLAHGLPAKVYGPNNENLGELNGGLLEYEALKAKMRDSRVYLYTGTQPASYTLNFIEAMMTGIPVVSIGKAYGNSLNLTQGDTFEVPNIIENGINGYDNDDPVELKFYIKELLNDQALAKKIGDAGRKTAIELFGKETIKQQWKEFLENG